VALLVFALLLGVVSGYWCLTNDSRIRRQVREYLRDITGAHVTVKRASFSIFGEIRVEGVRIDVPGDKGRLEPFVSAASLVLKHRPWAVFLSGRIEPTQIVSAEQASVTNSPHTRAFLRSRAFGIDLGGGVGQWAQPVIHLEKLVYVEIDEVKGTILPEERFELESHMRPAAPGKYEVFVTHREAEKVKQEYRFDVQLHPAFKVTLVSGSGDLVAAAKALPQEYGKWQDIYKIQGRQKIVGPTAVSEDSVQGVLELDLIDVSFKLPKDQGGLSLSNVKGKLLFTFPDESAADDLKNGRIEMRGITGRLAEAGDATIKLTGAYHGFRADSPFDVKIEIDNMTLPPGSSHPKLDGILKHVKRVYKPSGRMNLQVRLRRDAARDGVSVDGTILPRKMSVTHIAVPYRIEVVGGKIGFTNDRVVVEDLVGKREGGKFTINADAPLSRNPRTGKRDWTATVVVDFVRMTDALSAALPPGVFVGKPYPLRNIKGRVNVVDGRIWVDQDRPLLARGPGDMGCDVYGEVNWSPGDIKKVSVDVHIKADDVPLDRALKDSLDKAGRDAMELLSPSGTAERLSLDIHYGLDRKLTYRIDAGLKDVSITYKGFPYSITGLQGKVKIEPKLITLDGLTGRHGKTPVTLAGKLYPGSKDVGVDLTVGATELVLDKELYQALPEDLKKIWDGMSPSGKADVDLVLRENLPQGGKKLDYNLKVRPRAMTVTYKGFPYEFRGVKGEVTATPGVVTIGNLTCKRGYRLSGQVLGGGQEINLNVHARGVPIDKKLLAALPKELKAALKTIRLGGTLDVELDNLIVVTGKTGKPATAPADKPAAGAAAAATRPADDLVVKGNGWAARGSLGLHDTTVDVAFGAKKISGKLNGTIIQDSRGLAMNAEAAIDKVIVGQSLVTDVRGRISKKAGSPLVRIEDLEAKAYGGRLAGREVMIRLSEPVKYAFSVFYENVSLGELVNAGVTDPAKRTDVKGLLEGKISLEATAGDAKSRKAAGTVTITRGKMYKMPIILGVMHVLYLSLPGDAAFTDGYLKYWVQGDTMVIEEISLTGSALSLVGSGTMTMSNEKLDLTLLTGPPGQLPRIQAIRGASKVLNAILKELLIIRVTGTLSKPIRREVLLRSVDAILKELLSPGRPRM